MKRFDIACIVSATLILMGGCDSQSAENQSNMNGCEYDTQCKGDRVCNNRQCVTPSKTSLETTLPRNFVLPKNLKLSEGAIIFLDGTISAKLTGPRNIDGNLFLGNSMLVLGGANIDKTKLAARSYDGKKLTISTDAVNREIRVEGWAHCAVELEYLDKYYLATVDLDLNDLVLSVVPIEKPSLELQKVAF